MARPRTPVDKAKVTGQADIHKERFGDRADPVVVSDLGDPPTWMKDTDGYKPRAAWNLIKKEIPWLNGSHRALVEIAASIRGRLIGGQDVGVQAMNLLRQALGQMGATPADASKVGAKSDGQGKDPADEFFE